MCRLPLCPRVRYLDGRRPRGPARGWPRRRPPTAKRSSGQGEYRFRYELVPDGDGTEIRLDGSVDGLTGLGAFLGKFFVGAMKKACARDLAALKDYVERG